jgi:hypothetical protein
MPTNSDAADYKFVVLLNKKLEPGVVLNAAAHMVAALMDKAHPADREHMQFMDYVDAGGQSHPVSGLSLIVLRADNSNKIRTARQRAIEDDILHVDFTESMTGGSFAEQMQRTSSVPESGLDYYGLCLFGRRDKIDAITSRFSLWR